MVAALAWACHLVEGRRRPADSGNLFAVWPRKPRLLGLPPSRLYVRSRSSLCGGPSELASMAFRRVSVEGLSSLLFFRHLSVAVCGRILMFNLDIVRIVAEA